LNICSNPEYHNHPIEEDRICRCHPFSHEDPETSSVTDTTHAECPSSPTEF
jgi:hypothetical protein